MLRLLICGTFCGAVALASLPVLGQADDDRASLLAYKAPGGSVQFGAGGGGFGRGSISRPSIGGFQGGRMRARPGSGDQNFDNQGSGQNRVYSKPGQGQNNFDNDGFQPVQPSEAPAVPSLPKPVAAAAVPIVDFAANDWVAPPAYPSRQVINRLRDNLADVAATQLDLLDGLLKKSGLDRHRVDTLKQYARKTSHDEVSIRDFDKAIIDRDVEGAESAGELLKLDVSQLRQVLIYLTAARLRERYDAVLEDDDSRALREFRSEARDLRKRLADSGLERSHRDAIGETVDAVTATVNARGQLATALAELKEQQEGSAQLKWNTADELTVILDPAIKPGVVYYLTPECVLAGTRVGGRISVARSNLAGAFGGLAFESPAVGHNRGKIEPLREPAAVTIVNPANNLQSFAFQINGYDFTVEPGTMKEFTNSDAQKLDGLRFAPTEGAEKTGGFKLTEADNTPIKKAFFCATRSGGKWNISRKTSLPYLRGTATAAATSVPTLYLRNTTGETVNFKLGAKAAKLAPGQSQGFDATQVPAENPVIEFSTAGSTKPVRNTLKLGAAYQFAERDGSVAVVVCPLFTVTIDNQDSPFAFAHSLNGERHTVAPFEQGVHSFVLPPSEVIVSFDSGRETLTSVKCEMDQTYYVGVTPDLQLDLYADNTSALRRLSDERTAQLARDTQFEQLPSLDSIADAPAPPAETKPSNDPPPMPPAVVAPAERKPRAHVLAVGVSKYANEQFNLKFADRDAKDFVDVFTRFAKDFYDRISQKVLVDEEATSLAVKKGLNAVAEDAQSGDVVVLFFSSHGFSKSKRYYIGTHDLDPQDLLSTTVKHSDVIDAIETLTVDKHCQVIVFIDSCNSGAMTTLFADSQKGGVPLGSLGKPEASQDVSQKISSSGQGCLVFASSAEGQASIEDPSWQHGAFTKAFLDAVAATSTDQDGDGIIGAIELEPAMNQIIGDLTSSKQRVYVSWPNSVKNFPLVRLVK